MSTKPGATIFPVASMVSAASPSSGGLPAPRRRISTILPSLTAMSASNRSAPVPSTTVPPVILRSNTITPLSALPPATVANVTPLQRLREYFYDDPRHARSAARRCDRYAAAAADSGARGALLLRGVRAARSRADVAQGMAARLHRRPCRRTRGLLRIPLRALLDPHRSR